VAKELSLKRGEESVMLDGRLYWVREATAGAVQRFQKLIAGDMVLEDGLVVGMKGGPNVYRTVLLGLCVFNEDGHAIQASVIETWPDDVVETLYQMVVDLTPTLRKKREMTEEEAKAELAKEKEEAKN
jgi:hypothetical protein